MMQYRGYPRCPKHKINGKNCNYIFKNVGFQVQIPVKKLQRGQEYHVFLKLESKVLKKNFITPLYYPQDYHEILEYDNDRIHIRSSYQTMRLKQFYHTLVARTGASPYTKALRLGKSCSNAYGNKAFFKENTYFNKILGVEKYKGLITYYKLGVSDAGCLRNRRRVKEGKDKIAYVPSLYVNYTGESLKLFREVIYHKPTIHIQDFSVWQYDTVNLKKHAQAWDRHEGDISHRIQVKPKELTTRIPGQYQVLYYVKNRFGLSNKKEITVTVKKRPSRFRYIDQVNYHEYIQNNNFWRTTPYSLELKKALFASKRGQ